MNELLPFYERELAQLREYAQEFAQRHPKIAARLALTAESCEDPHAERLLQSFAFLSARISQKIEDDYPELTEALIDLLYPHYLRPFPACSIAQVQGSEAVSKLTAPVTIERGTELISQAVRNGTPCRFRTAYDVQLAPVQLVDAVFHPVVDAPTDLGLPANATASLSLTIQLVDTQPSLQSLCLQRLRLFIDAEPALASGVLDALFLKTTQVFVEADRGGKWRPVRGDLLHQVGIDEADALLEMPASAHPAYRLLSEYFAFPEKFNFFDIDLAMAGAALPACRTLTLHFVLHQLRANSPAARRLEELSSQHVRLGCTPVINLFKQQGDPIRLTHPAAAYPVLGCAKHAAAYEVYSIDAVKLERQGPVGDGGIEFHPFYSLQHGERAKENAHYWFARRNEWMAQRSPGYETEMSLVDIHFEPSMPRTESLSIELTCTNRDLPHGLAIGQPSGDLMLEGNTIVQYIHLLRQPTRALRLGRDQGLQWRLVSHLSTNNHLSLISSGLPALKDMLQLYNLGPSAVSTRQIEALHAIEQRPATQWLPGEPFASLVRGLELRLSVDESAFVDSSLHAFASVLDHFFGRFGHPNSFTQLVIVSARDQEELVRCKPRSDGALLL